MSAVQCGDNGGHTNKKCSRKHTNTPPTQLLPHYSWDHSSPSHEESWKPFLIDVDGGGGGGAPVPGLSGGRGGRGPLLGLESIPLLDGN